MDVELTGKGYRALSGVMTCVYILLECGLHKQFVQTDQNCTVKVYTFHSICQLNINLEILKKNFSL